MLESLDGFFSLLMRVTSETPVQVWSIVCGMLISWGITQRAKFMFPQSTNTTVKKYAAQSIAFALAFGVTFLLWPSTAGIVAGIINGVWAPFSYWTFIKILRWKFPKTADALSQDKNAWGE